MSADPYRLISIERTQSDQSTLSSDPSFVLVFALRPSSAKPRLCAHPAHGRVAYELG